MSEYTFLTGRPELFQDAPADAMVVLEHDDGRMFYAIAHDLGARYWNEDGTLGSKVGLIALHKKTRVVASRVRAHGLKPAEPKRDPIPKSRLDRMQTAQNGLKKAISQPMPVKPKPEPKPAPVKLEKPVITPKVQPTPPKPEPVKQAEPSVPPKADGFVSMFKLAEELEAKLAPAFINIQANGNIGVSTKIAKPGDRVDIQADVSRGLIRIARVSSGGKPLTTGRQFTARAVTKMFLMPEGQKHVRIELTETDGWFQGPAALVTEVRA